MEAMRAYEEEWLPNCGQMESTEEYLCTDGDVYKGLSPMDPEAKSE